jgi:hypothetical protein
MQATQGSLLFIITNISLNGIFFEPIFLKLLAAIGTPEKATFIFNSFDINDVSAR